MAEFSFRFKWHQITLIKLILLNVTLDETVDDYWITSLMLRSHSNLSCNSCKQGSPLARLLARLEATLLGRRFRERWRFFTVPGLQQTSIVFPTFFPAACVKCSRQLFHISQRLKLACVLMSIGTLPQHILQVGATNPLSPGN